MIIETKVRKIGNSLGVVLPKEALQIMKVEEGTTLYLTESTEGSVRVTAANPDFAEKAALADGIMKRYRNTLRELAK